ncbi:MAG TPA: ATP-binding protein, partial [Thermotogota bacterium]|nr:ATP-binding protein [Thermotogota bacterium]
IGNTDLFVGRKKEFDYFLGVWYNRLIGNMAQSQAIVARRKKGKTAFLQRLFNILWSCSECKVIPFYYSIQEEPITRASFAKEFFSTFAGHYLSFLTRNKDWVITPLNYVALKEHVAPYPELQMRCRSIDEFEKTGNWNLMWKVASRAPSEIAASKNFKIVQIIDEFQNINAYVLDERGNTIESLSGTYLDLAEKKEAPLIVSGSEVHGLMRIIQSLTARFKVRTLGNLPEEEAKEAIRRYGYVSQTKINEQAEEKIWNLTQGDPLYIRALMLSEHNEARDYTQESNIVETYTREITHGEIYDTWMEYIAKIFVEVNERNAKRILLYLFQAGEERTRAQIIKDLKLEMTDFELQTKLQKLMKADLISRG